MNNANDDNHRFTHADRPGDHGPTTGWHQQLASEGRHSSYSAQKWAARRVQPQQQLPVVQSPQVTDRGDSFLSGYLAAEQQRSHHLLGRAAGAVVGAVLVNSYLRNRGR